MIRHAVNRTASNVCWVELAAEATSLAIKIYERWTTKMTIKLHQRTKTLFFYQMSVLVNSFLFNRKSIHEQFSTYSSTAHHQHIHNHNNSFNILQLNQNIAMEFRAAFACVCECAVCVCVKCWCWWISLQTKRKLEKVCFPILIEYETDKEICTPTRDQRLHTVHTSISQQTKWILYYLFTTRNTHTHRSANGHFVRTSGYGIWMCCVPCVLCTMKSYKYKNIILTFMVSSDERISRIVLFYFACICVCFIFGAKHMDERSRNAGVFIIIYFMRKRIHGIFVNLGRFHVHRSRHEHDRFIATLTDLERGVRRYGRQTPLRSVCCSHFYTQNEWFLATAHQTSNTKLNSHVINSKRTETLSSETSENEKKGGFRWAHVGMFDDLDAATPQSAEHNIHVLQVDHIFSIF